MTKEKIKLTSSEAFQLQAEKFSSILTQLNEQTEYWIKIKNIVIYSFMYEIVLGGLIIFLLLFK